MAKTIKAMVKIKLYKLIKDHEILPYISYAYQKGKMASMCVNDVINVIAPKKNVVLLVMDLSNEYNFLNLNSLKIIIESE